MWHFRRLSSLISSEFNLPYSASCPKYYSSLVTAFPTQTNTLLLRFRDALQKKDLPVATKLYIEIWKQGLNHKLKYDESHSIAKMLISSPNDKASNSSYVALTEILHSLNQFTSHSTPSFNALLFQVFIKTSQLKKANDLFRHLYTNKQYIRSDCYVKLILANLEINNLKFAQGLLSRLLKMRINTEQLSFVLLAFVKALARNKQGQDIITFLKMIEDYDQLKECLLSKNLLTQFMASLCRCSLPDEALRLFSQKILSHIKTDKHIESTLLQALFLSGRYTEAIHLFHHLNREEGDPVNLTITLNAYIKTGMLTHALQIYREALQKGVVDIAVSSAILHEFAKKGKLKEVQEVIHLIEFFHQDGVKSKVVADIKTYSILILSLMRLKKYEEATKMYLFMRSKGIQADQYLYTILLRGYCRAKDTETLRFIEREIKESGLVANAYLNVALHESALLQGNTQSAKQIWMEILSNHIPQELFFRIKKAALLQADYNTAKRFYLF